MATGAGAAVCGRPPYRRKGVGKPLPDKINDRSTWAERMERCLPKRLRTPGVFEFLRYAVIGGLTFLLSNGLFILMYNALGWNDSLSKVLSELFAILFAYGANKRFVFRTHCKDRRDLFREVFSFFSARAATFALGIGAYELMVRLTGLSPNISQLISTVLVILLNYVFSKRLVFR